MSPPSLSIDQDLAGRPLFIHGKQRWRSQQLWQRVGLFVMTYECMRRGHATVKVVKAITVVIFNGRCLRSLFDQSRLKARDGKGMRGGPHYP